MKSKSTLVLVVLLSLGIGRFSQLSHATSTGPVSSGESPANPNIFVNLSKRVVPSVVNISTMSTVAPRGEKGSQEDLFRRFFEEFFHQQGGQGQGRGGEDEEDQGEVLPPSKPGKPGKKVPRAMSLGSGFVVDASGLILTNNHVVADAEEIKIYFTEEADEKPVDGEVVGHDLELDLALIRVKSKRALVALPLGDSDGLEVGEYVMAVGNPFGQGHSVTHGIISAKNREAPDFRLASYLQTDAPINPGNSGGPLINLKGEVIGINNAIDQRAVGIGFAIPINLVKAVLPQLKTKGTVSRGYIGVLVNEMSPEIAGKLGVAKDLRAPFVTHVYPNEPADKAGIKPYDVILELNGKPIHTSAELVTAVVGIPVNASVPVKLIRSGVEKIVSLKVGQRPGVQAADSQDGKIKKKKEKKPSHIDVGMELEDLTNELARELGATGTSTGAVVMESDYGGPADSAGLFRGDIIVEVDRKPIKDADAFYSIVKEKKTYLLRVRRTDPQGKEVFIVALLDLKSSSPSSP